MSRQVIFNLEARVEFEDAVTWYEQQRPGLGDRFEAEVHATFRRILQNPERFRPLSRTIHMARVKVFDKYGVYFRISPEFIVIVSVFHGSRDPAELRRRLQ